MIKYIPENQPTLFEFKTPFNKSLDLNNRWVELSKIVPWDKFANLYIRKMDSKRGRPGINPRIVLGALIIKSIEKLDDRGVIEAIQENVYMQFFVGLKEFTVDPVFDPSLFVSLRKRIGNDTFDLLNVELIKSTETTPKIKKRNDNSTDNNDQEGNDSPPNRGHLQADATVADQYITYPTDAKLLNSSRKNLEIMIDDLYEQSGKTEIKPRTYRKVTDKKFLIYSKKRGKGKKIHRKMNRKLLECVNRNIKYIYKLQDKDVVLSKKNQELFETILKIYQQQKWMYDNKKHSIKNRIVNLYQPHVRAIPRGKQKSQVEFGAKLGVSLDKGFARIDTLSWEAYHEGKDLKKQVENYKEIHGYYPELVLVDKAYSTRENREWLAERGIRITAVPLGRKKKKTSYYQKSKRKKEFAERNHIEAKFGQGKNGYNLNKIRATLKETSESWIACIFFIMNLINYQKILSFGSFFNFISYVIKRIKQIQLSIRCFIYLHTELDKKITFTY